MTQRIRIAKPESEFPELFVTVPDSWPHIKLAPLYDAQFGHKLHASKTFLRHLDWLSKEPHVLTWNGGDLIENAIIGSPGMFDQAKVPQEQFDEATKLLIPVLPKMLFAIPGNHEARTERMTGFSIARQLAERCSSIAQQLSAGHGIHYFPDFCFCTICWRGHKFRIAAHHGSGAAQTPGGQRNAARKDMEWTAGIDIYWTGHLHQPLVDLVYRNDFNQRTGQMTTRQCLVIVSPSYLYYFGSYAAARRWRPGIIGLVVATLQADGRIDAEIHCKGKRL